MSGRTRRPVCALCSQTVRLEHALRACGINSDERVATLMWNNQEHDIKLQIAGINTVHDEVVLSGDPSRDRDFTCFYLRQGRLIAADCVNRPRDFMFSKLVLNPTNPGRAG